MDRRTFLKITGMGSVAFAAGCNAHPERHLYTLVRAPEDMVTGEAAWYASTCRECPAGCGILAKNREGRVVKLEGNPLHPVNQGKLCARGHAALQGLYHPDRVRAPQLKTDRGWAEISFENALALIRSHIRNTAPKAPGRVAMLTEVVGNPLLTLFESLLSQCHSAGAHIFEPFAFESLKFAHATMFGKPILPAYRLERADLVVGFGADFLETWLSPVEYTRKFKTMHAWDSGQKGTFIHVGPYQSLTAANADLWVMCRPGKEYVVVMSVIRELIAQGKADHLPAPFLAALKRLANNYQPVHVTRDAQVTLQGYQQLLQRLRDARRPLVLPTATAGQGAAAAATDLATVMLNILLDPTLRHFDFDQRHRVEVAHTRAQINAFWQKTAQQPPALLLLNNVNPVFTMPANTAMQTALARKETFTVAFSRTLDETAAMADLVFPVQHPLEAWDAYESKQAMVATQQPTLGKIGNAPNIGDLFLTLLQEGTRPAPSHYAYMTQQIRRQAQITRDMDWLRVIQSGGIFVADKPATPPPLQLESGQVVILADMIRKAARDEIKTPTLQVTASSRFFDGRHTDNPWLAEIPDPITQVSWQTLALVAPQTMKANQWMEGQPIELATAAGKLVLGAYPYAGVHPSLIVVPAGQGHTAMGRYARNKGANPFQLLGSDPGDGVAGPVFSVAIKSMATTGPRAALAKVSGSRVQLGRKIALSVPQNQAAQPETGHGLTMNDFPLTLPLPEGYDHSRNLYPPHDHAGYRWGMTVDLDRCTGCGACVAGCYAENNVGVVGEKRIINGREMAWLRIERYEDPDDPTRLIFLPMMCQHCDNAPCESVCPVYAPHHSKEGLNNQIYNRCIGTRFCAQNCPYKVRRFNWFDWQWPEPLNMQLNPDVTVRSKGVMEKCSFCIQRIKAAHNQAKNENRAIRDGEVIPACVQTCPTDALVFGNLMDPGSAVRRLMNNPRAYQVMGYLNTKPAVVYLKKVVKEI